VAHGVAALGGIINIFNKTNASFVVRQFQIFKTKMKGSSINSCDFFFKFEISVRGCLCDYSPQVPKNLAMPLHVTVYCGRVLNV
jgi:hypothetical protein